MTKELTIIGNHHWVPLEYGHPEWIEEPTPDNIEPFFMYKGNQYWVSEFVITDNISEFKEFDGYMSDSFFSGILIKLSVDGIEDCVKVYTYFS